MNHSMPAPIVMITTLFAACVAAGLPARAADARLGPLRDLHGSFPFSPPQRLADWEQRRADVRLRVLVSQGLWPPPTKTPLNAVVHGTIEVDDPLAPGGGYTVSKVYFESLPGFFVTGNLYKPRRIEGRVPGVLFAHGHRTDARVTLQPADAVRKEIATGAERFERGGSSLYQSMCVQMARMGCVVWHWDMIGHSDSIQLSRDLAHNFSGRPAGTNGVERLGLSSPRAEGRLISPMGLQTWNSIRSLDFLLSLPDVDPERVAMTGSSGGGTQTMILAAVDDRLALSFPVVMVSTSMQGGCTCENASLLRIDTGNVEIAAVFAPKPQGMNTADDWTKEMATKGFPELRKLYGLYDAADRVTLLRGEHFPHNYNAVTRSAFHTFLNRHFRLGFPEPVIEHDFAPLATSQLSAWDADHPAPPAADQAFEQRLVAGIAADIDRQATQAAESREGIDRLLKPAYRTLLRRGIATAGAVAWEPETTEGEPESVRMTGILRNTTHDEEVPIAWIRPTSETGRVVVWLDTPGRDSLAPDRRPAAVKKLLAAGTAVMAADLYHARDAATNASDPPRQRTVKDQRPFPGFTFGYNDPAVVRSVHDLLTILAFLRTAPPQGRGTPAASSVAVAAFGDAAVVAAAARIVAAAAIDRTAIDTAGFRFAEIDDWRHPLFLPGAERYLDLPGMLATGDGDAWIAGESAASLLPVSRGKEASIRLGAVTSDGNSKDAAVEWLLEARPATKQPGVP